MSSQNVDSVRKRGPYSLKEGQPICCRESIPGDCKKAKFKRGPYHSDDNKKRAKLKRGPYLGNKTKLMVNEQLTVRHNELHQDEASSLDLNAATCSSGTVKDFGTKGTTGHCLPENNEPEDLSGNSTATESDIECDFDFCNDSDSDEDCSGDEKALTNQPLGMISPPLYQLPPSSSPYTAPISKTEHLTMVISYALKHCLTYQAFQDLLRLISLHCPQPSLCELSVFKAKASFVAIEDKIIYYDYCESCFQLFEDDEVMCQNCIKEENGGKIR